jgi:Transposase DNA-binding/Transposase Tn5 dimerisation domain
MSPGALLALTCLCSGSLTPPPEPEPEPEPEPDGLLDADDWAQQNFAAAELGDSRRTDRLVIFASAAATHPSGSIPQMCQSWADTKAAYRLFDSDGVTFTAVASPHWEITRDCGPGLFLVLGDTTEADFGSQRHIEGAGPLGNGSGQGFLLHSALLVSADSEAIHGLAGQAIHYRQAAPKKESATQRLKRNRESEVWCRVIDQVGRPPEGAEWVHVLDRGADNFEVYCHVRACNTGCVVRASSLNRKVLNPQGVEVAVSELLNSLPVAEHYELSLRARPEQPARTARLEVRFGSLVMPVPRVKNDYTRKQAAIAMRVVWVREVNPPKGAKKKIEWVLYTTLAVDSNEQARRVIEYYEKRWLIEEYHKALKTGCRIEERQLEDVERLEPLVGLLAVVAVRLLQLKGLARTEPDRPATQVVPPLYVAVLQSYKKVKQGVQWTVRQFFRELAKLGGFLGRKGDGEPGWITIWRGWDLLQWLVRGAQLRGEAPP